MYTSEQEDYRSFNRAHKELFRPICKFAYKIIDDWQEANTIVSDVFLECLKKGTDFDDLEQLQKYLYVAVYHDCIDHIRAQKTERKNRKRLTLELSITPEEKTVIETYIAEVGFLDRLYKDVQQLPDKQQKAVRGYYLDGRASKDLAGERGVAGSTDHNNRLAGLNNLRIKLQQRNIRIWLIICLLLQDHWKN